MNKPVPVQKTTPGLEFYPATTTDLDSSDLFSDYRHGPDKPQEFKQSDQPLFISVLEILIYFPLAWKEIPHDKFNLFDFYFPGNFRHDFVPLKMGANANFIP